MSRNNFELYQVLDGDVYLTFWNWATGKDVLFALKENGEAERHDYGDDGEDIVTPIPNLPLALREFMNEIPVLLNYKDEDGED